MAEKHLVKHWRGSRESYNLAKSRNFIDPWTIYHVIDTIECGTTITEYFGENIISQPTGQILAVNDILPSLPSSGINPYDRYLVGSNETGYKIYECTPIKDSDDFDISEMNFDWKYGVRILSRGLKNYVYYNAELITYDDVDCGEF